MQQKTGRSKASSGFSKNGSIAQIVHELLVLTVFSPDDLLDGLRGAVQAVVEVGFRHALDLVGVIRAVDGDVVFRGKLADRGFRVEESAVIFRVLIRIKKDYKFWIVY